MLASECGVVEGIFSRFYGTFCLCAGNQNGAPQRAKSHPDLPGGIVRIV
jgi:hypothetical protein